MCFSCFKYRPDTVESSKNSSFDNSEVAGRANVEGKSIHGVFPGKLVNCYGLLPRDDDVVLSVKVEFPAEVMRSLSADTCACAVKASPPQDSPKKVVPDADGAGESSRSCTPSGRITLCEASLSRVSHTAGVDTNNTLRQTLNRQGEAAATDLFQQFGGGDHSSSRRTSEGGVCCVVLDHSLSQPLPVGLTYHIPLLTRMVPSNSEPGPLSGGPAESTRVTVGAVAMSSIDPTIVYCSMAGAPLCQALDMKGMTKNTLGGRRPLSGSKGRWLTSTLNTWPEEIEP